MKQLQLVRVYKQVERERIVKRKLIDQINPAMLKFGEVVDVLDMQAGMATKRSTRRVKESCYSSTV